MGEFRRRSTNSSEENVTQKNHQHNFINKLLSDIRKFYDFQFNEIKWMNEKPQNRKAYEPTEIEHIANIVTHGFWILPSAYAAFLLLFRSKNQDQVMVALIYGSALTLLFCISTAFHCVFYCKKNLLLKDILHRMDRAMIYIFIAGSYFPWLNLGHTQHPYIVYVLKWLIWILAALGIIYQQIFHEKYKSLETIFYALIAIGPATVVILYGHEFVGMAELKIGGLLYLVGVFFFKADGHLSCAHAIWHLFVVLAASIHYFAILRYLFSDQYSHDHATMTMNT
ncbi:CLUMA_CG016311, isoform A [Clunio marinus]|uniref:CLUMA_CG016311, isoform A n=1 Tax=Clunio marinus TaxID=568069 RepID=A0A1J1IY15_9DIPT|nr:CLUMA_CG016311, isoform A [Clunio marinus]